MRRQGRASITPPPPVPCPPKMHCFFSTQIGLYIQQQGVQLPPRIEGAPAGLEYLTLVNEINWKKVSHPEFQPLGRETEHFQGANGVK